MNQHRDSGKSQFPDAVRDAIATARREGYVEGVEAAARVAAETAEAWGDLSLAPGIGRSVMRKLVNDIRALAPADEKERDK